MRCARHDRASHTLLIPCDCGRAPPCARPAWPGGQRTGSRHLQGSPAGTASGQPMAWESRHCHQHGHQPPLLSGSTTRGRPQTGHTGKRPTGSGNDTQAGVPQGQPGMAKPRPGPVARAAPRRQLPETHTSAHSLPGSSSGPHGGVELGQRPAACRAWPCAGSVCQTLAEEQDSMIPERSRGHAPRGARGGQGAASTEAADGAQKHLSEAMPATWTPRGW